MRHRAYEFAEAAPRTRLLSSDRFRGAARHRSDDEEAPKRMSARVLPVPTSPPHGPPSSAPIRIEIREGGAIERPDVQVGSEPTRPRRRLVPVEVFGGFWSRRVDQAKE